MRDDSTATVGIRALLGNTTSAPYNVYYSFLPETIDFTPAAGPKSFITYRMISESPDQDFQGPASLIMEESHGITVYSRSLETVESIHRRIKTLLQHKRSTLAARTMIHISEIKLDSEGPHTFDDVHKVWFQEKIYHAWGRDDNIS